eukprot:Blabericola_migrator_1__4334@NODE_2331_length_2924_cov_61_627231_g241_i1_p3_GENE_NODE_2331_length_2924_cov_61_627231_g241_i1NODE_2331_length_2924_cov_61_627231_g241_i1_p3_ORF_typecomplete_len106_score14_41RNA_pol_L_2/PF13656_6/7_6e27RNA_pol_L/PF01193_24/3RNA_pol_L/PF01193_24/13_NODE_2331_length_2924_cov_61_627231_g241_i114421759
MSFQVIEDEKIVDQAFNSKSVTLTVQNEDHTLGNALRSMLSSNPEVEFAGYSIPHPTETHFNLRIQSVNRPAMELFTEALDNLIGMSSVILQKLESAIENVKMDA